TMRRHGLIDVFPQTNHSMSVAAGIIRGLHYQAPPAAEAKLFRCVRGRVFDVIVDVRAGSATFLRWFGVELTEGDFNVVYVPPGCAHGYQALTDGSEVLYQSSAEYAPSLEGRVRYDDPRVGIRWPNARAILSPKDAATPPLAADFAGVSL
ncbi:MAG TPA: dTDP-4-dehydrorhamnose 3,5-epimerase, partial [Gemmata sp.]|nr:dTDP-4-dehydrorhamnose 3,5-epimerase [Gemmata sp.]